MKPLEGRIALVAGATRGAGRGVARMLGEAGAVVYCSGRNSRTRPQTTGPYAGRPETIEETAELVTAAGGEGIAVRTDHSVEKEVGALFARIRRERKRLDVVVNVFWGGPENQGGSFWKTPLDAGRPLFEAVWPHVITSRYAAALMVPRRSGLIVQLTEGDSLYYCGNVYEMVNAAPNTGRRWEVSAAAPVPA